MMVKYCPVARSKGNLRESSSATSAGGAGRRRGGGPPGGRRGRGRRAGRGGGGGGGGGGGSGRGGGGTAGRGGGGGAHAVPADVEHVEAHPPVVQGEHVQAVAGQLVAGLEMPGEPRGRIGRDPPGQERGLDPRGGAEVALHPAVDPG